MYIMYKVLLAITLKMNNMLANWYWPVFEHLFVDVIEGGLANYVEHLKT